MSDGRKNEEGGQHKIKPIIASERSPKSAERFMRSQKEMDWTKYNRVGREQIVRMKLGEI